MYCINTVYIAIIQFFSLLLFRSRLQHPGEHGATVLHGRWAAGASLHHRSAERPRAFFLGVVGLQQLTGGRGGPECRASPGPRLRWPWGRWPHGRAEGESQRAPAQAAAPAPRRCWEVHLPSHRAGKDTDGGLHRPQQEVPKCPDHSSAT